LGKWLTASVSDAPWLKDLVGPNPGPADLVRVRQYAPDLISTKFQGMSDTLKRELPDLQVPAGPLKYGDDLLTLARKLNLPPEMVAKQTGQAAQQDTIPLSDALDRIRSMKGSSNRDLRNQAYEVEASMKKAISDAGRADLATDYKSAVDNYRKAQRQIEFYDSGAVAPGQATGPVVD